MRWALGCSIVGVISLLSVPHASAASSSANAKITALLTPKATCDIISFQDPLTFHVTGAAGPVTIGLEDIDPESCAGAGMMPPTIKIVAFERVGPAFRQLNTDELNGSISVQKIEAGKVKGDLIILTMLVFGPNDPMCCAKTVLRETFAVHGNRIVRVF
jgi:hypothetical protein